MLRADNCLSHHLWNRHKFVSFRLVASNQLIGCENRLRTVSSKRLVAAVVQQNHVPAADLMTHFPLDVPYRLALPIPAGDIPHYRLQPEPPRYAQSVGSSPAKRRTKQA